MIFAVIPVTFFITLILLPYTTIMLENAHVVKKNYMGNAIPVGMGIIFIPAVITGITFLISVQRVNVQLMLLNLLGVTVMGFAGIIDDLMGSRDTLGFRGHIKTLLKGCMTTGGFKAIMGGLIASVISIFISNTVTEWILNVLMIALFTNMCNLMDLRPGRSIKFFFLSWLFSIAGWGMITYNYLLFPLAGSLIAYMPADFKGKAMMGDAGANIIGISIGFYYSLITGLWAKIAIVAGLIVLHIIAERYSFTGIIDRNRILSFIDSIGTINGKGEVQNDKN